MASAQAAVQQPAANAQSDAADVRDPVVKVGAAVKAGLDEFNGPTEGAPANKDRQQTNAARAGQREGECGKGYKVHQLVDAIKHWGRPVVHWPEHRDSQGERHGERQGYVEVLAHLPGCIGLLVQRQARPPVDRIRS